MNPTEYAAREAKQQAKEIVNLDGVTAKDAMHALIVHRFAPRRDDTGKVYGEPREGPNYAASLRMVASRARVEYAAITGGIPGETPVADAIKQFSAQADCGPTCVVPIRVARLDDRSIVLNLGRADGQVVRVDPSGWETLDRSPVTFLPPSPMLGELPIPSVGCAVDDLRDLLNVTDQTWPMVLAWCVATLIPEIQHPALFVRGQQGSAKSSMLRILIGCTDPTGVGDCLMAPPDEPEDLAVLLSNRWITALDNMTEIKPWLSDALARAVTGSLFCRRMRYTQAELSTLAVTRPLAITGIDISGIGLDLNDRALQIDLEPITGGRFIAPAELDARLKRLHGPILGALLETLAATERAAVEENGKPIQSDNRMADFGRFLRHFDAATGLGASEIYSDQRAADAADAVEDSPLATAIGRFIAVGQEWAGSPSELIALLEPFAPPRDEKTGKRPRWPNSSEWMGRMLTKLAPALASIGVTVSKTRTGKKRSIGLSRTVTSDGMTGMTA